MKKIKISKKGHETIQSAMYTSFVCSYYLNEAKGIYFHNRYNLPIPVIKGKDKLIINKAMESLVRIEKELFSPIDEDELGQKINDAFMENLFDFTKFMIEGKSFYDFAHLQTLVLAYGIDKDNMMEKAQEVLRANSKKE